MINRAEPQYTGADDKNVTIHNFILVELIKNMSLGFYSKRSIARDKVVKKKNVLLCALISMGSDNLFGVELKIVRAYARELVKRNLPRIP